MSLIDSRAIDAVVKVFSDAIGAGEPEDQIVAGLLIGALIIVSSPLSGGAKLVLLPIPLVMIALGVIRLVPAIDNLYPL